MSVAAATPAAPPLLIIGALEVLEADLSEHDVLEGIAESIEDCRGLIFDTLVAPNREPGAPILIGVFHGTFRSVLSTLSRHASNLVAGRPLSPRETWVIVFGKWAIAGVRVRLRGGAS